MNEATYLSALSGLLHDIGKFALRAAEAGTRTWDEEAKGDFKYKHAMLTASFVQRYVPSQWRAEVQQAAGNHHNPLRPQDRAVHLADILSAAERDDGTTADSDVRKQHPQQLLSIFTALTADDKPFPSDQRQRAYLPLKPLALERDVLFPGEALPKDAVWGTYHKDLWLPFTTAADQLKAAHEPDGDLPTYVESMLLLLQRFTWCIPSAYYKNVPDISLYDHSRMTSALAAVLPEAAGHTDPETGQPLVLLVGGDISGVQDFIYTISSRGATSALRGRSFYLQLLTEAIVRYVLRRLDLPVTNIVYAGGGRFYLLARTSDAGLLLEIQREISRVLLQQHRGDLYVALASLPLAGADFFAGRISGKWGELGERLQDVKQRRFAELGEELSLLFAPQGHGGNREAQCVVCGLEHAHTTGTGEVRKCPPCASYETLGKDLRRAQYLLLEEIPPVAPALDDQGDGWEQALGAFGLRADVGEDAPKPRGEGRGVLLHLKDGLDHVPIASGRQAVGRRFLVNVTPMLRSDEIDSLRSDRFAEDPHDPMRRGDIKSFGILEHEATGIKRLGVLRMDVDNLGKLFSTGLGEKATLSRVASLSFAFSLFFEGWVEQLAETQPATPDWGDRLYSIYSGGDDLFFVGSWDAVVEFARRVRADLTPYAAGHPGIHASAGIALVGGKYPLSQAAEQAGRAEARAKARQVWKEGTMVEEKDAICFLEQVQPWRSFGMAEACDGKGDSIHGLMHLLVKLTDDQDGQAGAAPKSLLQTLVRLYGQYDEVEDRRRRDGTDVNRSGEAQPLWGPWNWRGVYMLSRATSRASTDPTVKESIRSLAVRFKEKDYRNMDWIGLAARWAELVSRS